MPKKGPRASYSEKRTAINLNGEKVSIRVSKRELNKIRIPNTLNADERKKLFEYLGVLMGRGHCKAGKKDHLIRRHSRIHGDLEGKYVKLHGELFGIEPSVKSKGRNGNDIRAFSMGTYEYLTKVSGFNSHAETKQKLLAKDVMEHLLEDPLLEQPRQSFLKGFFHTHLTPSYKPEQSMKFMLSFEHANPVVAEFVDDLCKKEGIKTTVYKHRRFIIGSESKLKALSMLNNPYELGKLIAIVTERKGFGNIHIDPKELGRRMRKADLENVPPGLVRAEILDKVEKYMKKGLFGRFSPRSQESFRKKLSARKQSIKTPPKKAIRRSKKRIPKKKPKPILIPSKKKRLIQFQGNSIDLEHQIHLLEEIRKKLPYTMKTHLTRINSGKGIVGKLADYAATYHPEKKALLKILTEVNSNQKKKRGILKIVQKNKRKREKQKQ